MRTFSQDLNYFEGNRLIDLFNDYKNQREQGILSGSCSSDCFPKSMDFRKWLRFQVSESCFATHYDI